MPVTINGDGSIAGVSVGGLPDGSVDADTLAANAVTSAKVASAAITSTELHDDAVTSSKLPSGTVVQALSCSPVISGYWANQTDWTDVTGMSITITPKASTNKLLLRAQVHQGDAGNDFVAAIGFRKNGTLLSYTVHQNWGYGDFHQYSAENDNSLATINAQCEREEVAGSTSALTFQVCIRSGAPSWQNNNVYVGRANRSDDRWYNCLYVRSTFRILEIAA